LDTIEIIPCPEKISWDRFAEAVTFSSRSFRACIPAGATLPGVPPNLRFGITARLFTGRLSAFTSDTAFRQRFLQCGLLQMQMRRSAFSALLTPFPNYLGVGVGIGIGVESPAAGNLGFRAASAFFRYRPRPRLEILLTRQKMGKLLIRGILLSGTLQI